MTNPDPLTLFHMIPNAIAYCEMVFDDNGQSIDFRLLDFNDSYVVLTSLDRPLERGMLFSEATKRTLPRFEQWLTFCEEALQKQQEIDTLYYSIRLNRHYQIHVKPIDWKYFFFQIIDVTVQTLKASEKEIVLQALKDIVFELDDDFVFLNVYTSDDKKLFIPRQHLVGYPLTEYFPSALAELFLNSFKQARSLDQTIEITFKSPLPLDDRWFNAQQKYLIINDRGRFISSIVDITDEKKIKDALDHQTQTLEKFLTVNLDLLCIVDLQGRFVRLNEIWTKTLGYALSEMIHQPIVDFVHPDDVESTLLQIEHLKSKEEMFEFTNRYRKQDGTYRVIEWRASLGDNNLIYAAARDVTEHKQMEHELIYQKERFELAIEGSQQGIWDWDIREDKVFLSKRLKKLIGYEDEELPNAFSSFSENLYAEDRDWVLKTVSKCREGLINDYDIEFRMIHKEGHPVWIRSIGNSSKDENDIPIRMAGTHIDITESKLARQQLEEAYFRLNQVAEYARVMTWEIDKNGLYTYISPICKDIIGYDASEIIDKKYFFDFHPKQGSDEFKQLILDHMSTGAHMGNIENIIISKEGNEVWVLTNGIPMMDDHGELIGYRGSDQDISLIKHQQQALKESEEKYRMLTESLSDIVWIFNYDTFKFEYFSQSVFFLSGYPVDEMLNMDIREIMTEESYDRLTAIIQSTIEQFTHDPTHNHTMRCEIQFITKSNELHWVELVFKYRFSEKFEIEVIGVGRDIHQRKQVEMELQYLSFHDPLTGLYNRNYYEIELDRLNTARNIPLSLIMADINDLKLTNDAFGHLEGDLHIKDFADILRDTCREDDIIARTGGDEFVILLPQTTQEDVMGIVQRLQQKVDQHPTRKIKLTVSIGHMTTEEVLPNTDILFKVAEEAMYRQKLRTRDRQLSDMQHVIMSSFIQKYPESHSVCQQVGKLAEAIAIAAHMDAKTIEDVMIASKFSMVGMLNAGCQDFDLCSSKITEFSYQIIKQLPDMRDIADIVLAIFERVDGQGYPRHLPANEIPVASKIVRIAWDYMDYQKRKKLAHTKITEKMKEQANKIYDPTLLQTLFELVDPRGNS